MKKYILIIFTCIALVSNAQTWTYDSVFMGPGYKNDVFYSLDNRMIDTVPLKNWHLAFSALGGREAYYYTIMANHSNDVRVRKYPNGDVSNWANVDTTGFNNWRIFFNGDEKWSEGAFNRDPESHPFYSWGIYNSNSPGQIDGDSIFIVYAKPNPPATAWYKKIAIGSRKSINGLRSWSFRIANIDGTEDTTITLEDKNYPNNHFSYYNVLTNKEIKREPDSNKWDLLFTRYFAKQNDPNVPYYQVAGVLQNIQTKAIKITGEHSNDVNVTDTGDSRFSDKINTIGFDWKNFDFNTNQFKIADSTTYVILTKHTDINNALTFEIFKLKFSGFGGAIDGKFVFATQKMTTTTNSVHDIKNNPIAFAISPNPVHDIAQLYINTEIKNDLKIDVIDMQGKIVKSQSFSNQGFNVYPLHVNNLEKGVYLIQINSKNNSLVQKIIIE